MTIAITGSVLLASNRAPGPREPAVPVPTTPSTPTPAPSPTQIELAPRTLGEKLDALLAAPFLTYARAGISVLDVTTGKVLYAHNPDLLLNPASNVKLVTSAAALALLGPEYRYSTRLYAEHDALRGHTVRGPLYLEGGGDPDLVTADLYELASDLYARGVRTIDGGIVVDGNRFDRDELPPGYDQKDEMAGYRAPVGAASVNFNTYVVNIRPGRNIGELVAVNIDPPIRSMSVRCRAKTGVGYRNRLMVSVEQEDERTQINLDGVLGVDSGPVSYRYPVSDPSRNTAEVLSLVLRQRGIRLNHTGLARGRVPERAELLAVHRSPALSVLVRAINKLSNNFMAESVLKSLAPNDQPGTFARALERIHAFLDEIGLSKTGLVIGNGSGLYNTNRISATQMTYLLRHVYRDFRYSADFLASLAIMGADGTIRSRLRGSPVQRYVRAKTGTLDDVSCLSGYAGAVGGTPVAFSFMFNGIDRLDAQRARELQNQMAEVIAIDAAGVPLPPALPVTPQPGDELETIAPE